jgi:hypothetical protein
MFCLQTAAVTSAQQQQQQQRQQELHRYASAAAHVMAAKESFLDRATWPEQQQLQQQRAHWKLKLSCGPE